MKTIRLISIILGVLIAIVGFALGVGFLIAFLNDKLGKQWIIFAFVIVLLALVIILKYLERAEKKRGKNDSDLLRIGKLIFQNHKEEFDSFYNLYLHDKKKFSAQKELQGFDLENLRPIDVLSIFGESKNLVHLIDWRGEEDEDKIETHIEENILKEKHNWTNTNKLRLGVVSDEKQRNGKFIIDLFKSVDKDLQTINQRIIFLDLGSDAYAYMTVDSKTFDEIIISSPDNFHGTNKLRK
ncbi:hypothetical protein NF867_09875 [Solitalea sp. MAHUQ-68]|uniref:DUF6630 domain-containing protein n=1 Tax=Solitalea agri TaxID=2953739 RepID=A0A9X2F225_9SPHI|nr:hypothetical protein [Solitalea agri]MCO4293172.1 hypothetical protein [Solitalea agri]